MPTSTELRPLTRKGGEANSEEDEEAAQPDEPKKLDKQPSRGRVVARLLSFAAEDRALVAVGAVAILVSRCVRAPAHGRLVA